MRDHSRAPPPLLAVAAQVPPPPSPKPFARFFNSTNCLRTRQDVPLPPFPAHLAFPSSNSSSSASSSVDYRPRYSDEHNYPPSHFSPPNSPEPKLTALRRRLTSLSFNPRSNASAANTSSSRGSSEDLGASFPAEQHRISQPLLHQQRPPLSPSAFSFNNPRTRPPFPPSPLITSYAPSPQRSQLSKKLNDRKKFWNDRLGAGEQQRAAPRKLGEALNGLVKRARSRVGRKGRAAVSKSGSLDFAPESVRWTREVDIEQESQLREAVKGLFGAGPGEPGKMGARSVWLHGSGSVEVRSSHIVNSPTSHTVAPLNNPRLCHHTPASFSFSSDTSARPCSPIRRTPAPLLPRPSLGTSFEMDRFGPLFDKKVSDSDECIQARRSVRQVASATVVSQRKETRRTSRRSFSSPALHLAAAAAFTTTPTPNLDPHPLPHYPNSPRPCRHLDPELSHSFIEHQTDAYVDGGWDMGTPTKRRQVGEGETIRIRIIEPTPPWLKSLKDQQMQQEKEYVQPRVQELARDDGGRGAGGADPETSFELHRQASELWLARQEQSGGTSSTSNAEIDDEEEPDLTDSPLRHRTRLSTSLSDLSNLSTDRHTRPLPLPPLPPPPCSSQRHQPAAVDFTDDQNAPLPPRLNRRVRLDASPSHDTLGKGVASNRDGSSSYSESEGSVNHELEQREIIDEMDRLLDEMRGVSDDEESDEVVWEGSRFEDAEEDGVMNDEAHCYELEDRSLIQSPTFGQGFSAFLLASTSDSPPSDPFNEPTPSTECIPFPNLPTDHQQSRLASRRGCSPLPPLDLPQREPAGVQLAPSGYHSEESESREQVGSWAFGELGQEEEGQEWTPTPESEERTPRPPLPTLTSLLTELDSSVPSFPSSSTPRRLTTLSAFSPSASFPSPSSTYSSTPSPPRARLRTLSTPSLLLGPFSPSARQPDSPSSHYFSPPKASASLAQSPGSVLVSSGGPESEDWRLSPVLVGGRETLRRLGSERG